MATKVYEISSVDLEATRTKNVLRVSVTGTVPTSGYSNPQLAPWIYVKPPQDGIYDFDFIADEPKAPVPEVITPISHSQLITITPDFKGLRIHASNNEMVVHQLLVNQQPPIVNDPFTIIQSVINKDKLIVTVRYGGGLQIHGFEAHWDGMYQTSLPPQVDVFIYHNAHNDKGKALLMQEIWIDLMHLSKDAVIHLHGLEANLHSIEFKHSKEPVSEQPLN